ncbi:hypothetical protein [Fluoribacter gormanii]|nr:hypothetical protein [Fluoribacter gormanii]
MTKGHSLKNTYYPQQCPLGAKQSSISGVNTDAKKRIKYEEKDSP